MLGRELEFGWQCGGSDIETWKEYGTPSEVNGSLKPEHLQRSCYHQPNHFQNLKVKEVLAKLNNANTDGSI